ncbi:MAG: hypothetical protein SA378_08595 [Sedimentibacter sp.]|uniref:hypothetical protein n=1 Tax=Sedimentibacter sp. TaxID=1960295 RepID=UPI0029827F77|nr:hypothetical protein [Sedimentibacter sp.]MDW5300179.1 hypothetical protein [Sedimentibacter sp.]
MDIIDNEKPYEEKDSIPIRQNNVIDEIRKLEQQVKDSNSQTFKKSTYWNQLNKPVNNEKSENLLKEIVDYLARIEAKLTNIEILLKKNEI